MSQADDAGASIGLPTGRGRDYPTIRQFTIFLENKVGSLQALSCAASSAIRSKAVRFSKELAWR